MEDGETRLRNRVACVGATVELRLADKLELEPKRDQL